VTYSIVARDASTGELGVGVQSQAFNTGAAVPWARPGVGAVATQSFTDRRYGWRGLELMEAGASPAEALDRLRADDELVETRQVAIIDPAGAVAQHTGAACIPAAGHVSGVDWAAQGNMLASERAWHEMGAAFERADGTLAQRLLAALDAAEATGGDWRGRGGAAILVVPAEGSAWERVIDLRVEEGDGSLVELRRLVDRAEAYRETNRASRGRAELGTQHGLPERYVEWLAFLDAAADGDVAVARERLRALEAVHPGWRGYARAMATHPDFPALGEILAE
jgi:uncharacterized Ntn-hydrolase superfamily protein